MLKHKKKCKRQNLTDIKGADSVACLNVWQDEGAKQKNKQLSQHIHLSLKFQVHILSQQREILGR